MNSEGAYSEVKNRKTLPKKITTLLSIFLKKICFDLKSQVQSPEILIEHISTQILGGLSR